MHVVQDGPPPGGFPAVRYARRVPSTGPGGVTLFGVGIALMAYGMYQVGQSNRERRGVMDERTELRAALIPFLQAEEDRRWVRAHYDWLNAQAGIMRDRPEYDPKEGPYKTRWMPPSTQMGLWNDN